MTIISKDAWRERFAQHLVTRSGMSREMALGSADAALEQDALHEVPEDAADEEMSCWTDDEGQID